MDALLAETVIGRQLDFDGENLPDRRHRQRRALTSPSHQQAVAANVLGLHRRSRPERRRRDVAAELDFDSRAFAPIYVSHFRASTIANLAGKPNDINIVNGLYRAVSERYQFQKEY